MIVALRGVRVAVKVPYQSRARKVAREVLGRRLRRGEVVHHRDGNRSDNRPDNLMVMPAAEHSRLHATQRREWNAIMDEIGVHARRIGMKRSVLLTLLVRNGLDALMEMEHAVRGNAADALPRMEDGHGTTDTTAR